MKILKNTTRKNRLILSLKMTVRSLRARVNKLEAINRKQKLELAFKDAEIRKLTFSK